MKKNILALMLVSSALLIAQTYVIPPSVDIYNMIPRDRNNRHSSYPLTSGDTFRAYCDHIIDETKIPFDPHLVKENETIFVNPHALHFFFSTLHPHIKNKYILVTHNSDLSIPGEFKNYLEDPKLKAWFGQNTDIIHPKVFALPIGLANRYWGHGHLDTIKNVMARHPFPKKYLLYMNFEAGTNPSKRTPVFHLFKNMPFCYVAKNKPWGSYLQEMATAKFVLSPAGNGLDCHRNWEAIYMGCIPIVLHSTLDPLYENLPVLIIDSWDQITKEFLEETYVEMHNKTYNLEKAYADYWFNLIESIKHQN